MELWKCDGCGFHDAVCGECGEIITDVESDRPPQDEPSPSIGDGQQRDNLAGVRQIAEDLIQWLRVVQWMTSPKGGQWINIGMAKEQLEAHTKRLTTELERKANVNQDDWS